MAGGMADDYNDEVSILNSYAGNNIGNNPGPYATGAPYSSSKPAPSYYEDDGAG